MDNPDPTLQKDLRERELPMEQNWRTLRELPSLPPLLNEILLPIFANASIERLAPSLISEALWSDKVDPNRATARRETELPNMAKSRMLAPEPNLEYDRILTDEPKVMKFMMLMALPNLEVERQLQLLPTVMKFRMEILEAIFTVLPKMLIPLPNLA